MNVEFPFKFVLNLSSVCYKNNCELLKFVYADNITVSFAWTVYNDNGPSIWFLRDNAWNVLMFSDVWHMMQFELSMISVCDQ